MKKRKILITIFIIILLIICVYEIYHIILRRVYPTNYSEHVEKYSKKYEGKTLEFQIRNYLYKKGFTIDSINNILNDYE